MPQEVAEAAAEALVRQGPREPRERRVLLELLDRQEPQALQVAQALLGLLEPCPQFKPLMQAIIQWIVSQSQEAQQALRLHMIRSLCSKM